MNHLTSVPNNGSPFDAIRKTREDGAEFWSARDLMPLLGYEKWERFSDSIERATATLANLGHDIEGEASRLREPSGLTNQMREDVHLSRFASYLVAMNGDPRKPEVAAAQAYFAVKTREAEVAAPVELSDDELIFRALTVSTRRIEALTIRAEKAEAQVEKATPAVEYVERYVADADVITVKDWGAQFGLTEPKARALLLERGLIKKKSLGTRWSGKHQRIVEEHEYRAAAGLAFTFFDLRPQHNAPRHHNGQVRQTLYVRQKHALDLGRRARVAPASDVAALKP